VSGRAERLAAGLVYIARGWYVFVLSPSKTPVANCEPCRTAHTTSAQMEACACLCCHGFHAATLDPDRLDDMLRLHLRGLLAIRTGAPSGTVVIDVDPPGIATMKMLVGDGVLPRTLAAVTGRGGYHLLYAHLAARSCPAPARAAPGSTSRPTAGTSWRRRRSTRRPGDRTAGSAPRATT
jgi:hypothetical protein